MIKFKEGDLIQLIKTGKYDVALHGVNCHCKMSDGVALQIAKAFPIVEQADLATRPLDKNKLGTFIAVDISIKGKAVKVLNCYTQFNYAGFDIEEAELFDYKAFTAILKEVAKKFPKEKIVMPMIGTGHAGGDRDKILTIIKQELKHNNVDVIIYCPYNKPKELTSLINKIKCLFIKIT